MLERWSQTGGLVGHGLVRSYGTPVSLRSGLPKNTPKSTRGKLGVHIIASAQIYWSICLLSACLLSDLKFKVLYYEQERQL